MQQLTTVYQKYVTQNNKSVNPHYKNVGDCSPNTLRGLGDCSGGLGEHSVILSSRKAATQINPVDDRRPRMP